MKEILNNYKSTFLLLGSVIAGGIIGAVFGERAEVLKPIGTIFINFMFVTIVPLVFFSVSSSVANGGKMERVGKILGSTLGVFLMTALIAALLGYIGTQLYNPLQGVDASKFLAATESVDTTETQSLVDMIIRMITVSDFSELLSKNNLLPLIIFSLLFGFATMSAGEKGKPMAQFLQSGSETMIQFVGIIMKFAPLGLGCYFAYTIGAIGTQILGGYLNSFILYLVLSLIYFFIFYTLYAFIAGGKDAVKVYWKNLTAPALSAIATTSSAACIPVNIVAAKKMGIPDDIAESVLPLGANTHKDGSVIGGVIKIVFLMSLTGYSATGMSGFIQIVGGAMLVGVVIGSIPSGGLTAELTICTLFGFPLEMVPVILVISTIIDVPATLLNSTGNIACSMLVARIVDGKEWLKNATSKIIN